MDSVENDIVIFGNSGHAKVIFDLVSQTTYTPRAFIGLGNTETMCGLPCQREDDFFSNPIVKKGIVAIGDNQLRRAVAEKIIRLIPNFEFISLVDDSATISSNVKLGSGTVVLPGSIINIGSVIGKHCIINTKVSIDHDCLLGDFVSVSPGATLCGSVTVEKDTMIGAGSTVIQNTKIGENVLVGAGSVVVNNIKSDCLSFGNPSRYKKNRSRNESFY